MQRGYALMAKSIVDGANMLTTIINDPDVSPRVKVHAIEILFDRVLGKPREFVSLDVAVGDVPAWQKAVAQGLVGSVDVIRGMEERGEIVEGEIVEGEIVEDHPEIPRGLRKPKDEPHST